MAWDFETEPEYQKLGLGRRVRARGGRAARPAWPHLAVHAARTTRRARSSTRSRSRCATRAVGHAPRSRARRPGLRPAQARAAQRDPRPVAVGADRLRLPGPRHRQRRDHRPLRHAGAEGALPAPAARRRDLLLLLDDRAAGAAPTRRMFTTRAVQDGDEWVINGWKFFSSNARTASFLIVMAVTEPGRQPVPGHVDVPGADRHPGRRTSCATSAWPASPSEGSHALIHYEDVRVPADGAARRRGPGVRHRPDPPRRRPHPPRHAHDRPGPQGARHDVRAGAQPRDAGQSLADKQFVQGYIADSYAQLIQFRLFVLYTAWEIDKYNDYRKVRKDIAAVKVLMPSVLHDIAWRAMQVHGALGVSNEMPFIGDDPRRQRRSGLADGPTEVHKVTVARQVLRDYQASDDLWPTEHIPEARSGAGRSSPSTSSTRWGTCDRRTRTARRRGWTTPGSPGKGEPLDARFLSGGTQNEIYEIRRGDLHVRHAHPARPPRPPDRDDGILREWRIIEALDGTDVPHTRGRRRVHRPVGARPDLLPDGLRRRLVADGPARTAVAGAVRHRPRAPGRASPTSWSRASRCCPRSTGRRRAWTTSAGPTASTSARSTAGPRSSSASRAASCRASTRRRRGCARTGRSTSSPGSCTATTSSPT